MEAAYFNNSGAVQGVVILTQEVKIKYNIQISILIIIARFYG